jgi:hypothetical protein
MRISILFISLIISLNVFSSDRLYIDYIYSQMSSAQHNLFYIDKTVFENENQTNEEVEIKCDFGWDNEIYFYLNILWKKNWGYSSSIYLKNKIHHYMFSSSFEKKFNEIKLNLDFGLNNYSLFLASSHELSQFFDKIWELDRNSQANFKQAKKLPLGESKEFALVGVEGIDKIKVECRFE